MNKQQESTVLHVLLATMLGICLVLGQGLYSAVAIAEEMSDDLGPDSIELIDEVPECEVVAQEEAEDEDSAIICMESNDTPIVVNESDNNAQSGEDIEQQGLMYGHDDVDGVEIQSSDASSAHDNLYARGISTSAMVATTSGYTRIYYQDGKVCIEDYDNGFKLINKRTLQGELDYWQITCPMATGESSSQRSTTTGLW